MVTLGLSRAFLGRLNAYLDNRCTPMTDLYVTNDQLALLEEVVDAALQQTRKDCWIFEPGSPDWNRLVERAKALKGLLSEIETA